MKQLLGISVLFGCCLWRTSNWFILWYKADTQMYRDSCFIIISIKKQEIWMSVSSHSRVNWQSIIKIWQHLIKQYSNDCIEYDPSHRDLPLIFIQLFCYQNVLHSIYICSAFCLCLCSKSLWEAFRILIMSSDPPQPGTMMSFMLKILHLSFHWSVLLMVLKHDSL